MTDYARTPPPPPTNEDRTMAIIVHALLLAGMLTSGVTSIVGVVLAYVKRDSPDPVAASHHRYAIGTFWIGFWGTLISILVMIGGAITMAVGAGTSGDPDWSTVASPPAFVVGIVLMVLGGLAILGVHIWVLIRSVFGLIRLSDGRPIGRPM